MNYCKYCGQEIDKTDEYCPKCGKSQSDEIKINNKANKEGLGTTSMILGIISLILAFIINLFVLPLALAGLIIGIVNKAQNGKKVSGIILNGIAMIVSVLVFIALIVLLVMVVDDYDTEGSSRHHISEIGQEEVLGKWNCKSPEKVLSNDYELILELDSDRKFTIKENNNERNYIKGIYSFEEDNKHTIGLNPLEKYENGDLVNKWDNTDDTYIMVVRTNRNRFRAILADNENEKVYYCKK